MLTPELTQGQDRGVPFDRELADAPRSQTIVRQVPSIDGERFCILHEKPLSGANAFVFISAAEWLTVAEVCDRLIAAGMSGPDLHRLLDEARAGYGPCSVA